MGEPVLNKVKEKNKNFFRSYYLSTTPVFHLDSINPLTLKVL